MENGHLITSAEQAGKFLLGGKSVFTLVSKSSGARYTYKVSQSKDNQTLFFVNLLTGADNVHDYTYLGIIQNGGFRLTGKSKMTADSSPVKAFTWAYGKLLSGNMPESLEFWHCGRCARCGRLLTVPASIESGFGPECIGKM